MVSNIALVKVLVDEKGIRGVTVLDEAMYLCILGLGSLHVLHCESYFSI